MDHDVIFIVALKLKMTSSCEDFIGCVGSHLVQCLVPSHAPNCDLYVRTQEGA